MVISISSALILVFELNNTRLSDFFGKKIFLCSIDLSHFIPGRAKSTPVPNINAALQYSPYIHTHIYIFRSFHVSRYLKPFNAWHPRLLSHPSSSVALHVPQDDRDESGANRVWIITRPFPSFSVHLTPCLLLLGEWNSFPRTTRTPSIYTHCLPRRLVSSRLTAPNGEWRVAVKSSTVSKCHTKQLIVSVQIPIFHLFKNTFLAPHSIKALFPSYCIV